MRRQPIPRRRTRRHDAGGDPGRRRSSAGTRGDVPRRRGRRRRRSVRTARQPAGDGAQDRRLPVARQRRAAADLGSDLRTSADRRDGAARCQRQRHRVGARSAAPVRAPAQGRSRSARPSETRRLQHAGPPARGLRGAGGGSRHRVRVAVGTRQQRHLRQRRRPTRGAGTRRAAPPDRALHRWTGQQQHQRSGRALRRREADDRNGR